MARYKRVIDVRFPKRDFFDRLIRELARRGVPYKAAKHEPESEVAEGFYRLMVRPVDLCFTKTVILALKNTKVGGAR